MNLKSYFECDLFGMSFIFVIFSVYSTFWNIEREISGACNSNMLGFFLKISNKCYAKSIENEASGFEIDLP